MNKQIRISEEAWKVLRDREYTTEKSKNVLASEAIIRVYKKKK